ncbi:TetR/AcrR family transcriptional regulator [Nonomuraea sp. NPDC049269]|uniref:TetR/AcrR family transcriptional regulator n=1 Tax=Nonomuraea sp. NPDC049269 TaxID=3364349 RepID=UPI0037136AE4
MSKAGRASARRQAKREEIARSAIEPLSKLGLRNVTLADLGSALGMSGAHLLYYFDSKVDLFMAALRLVEQDLYGRVLAAFETTESARRRWEILVDKGAPVGLGDSGLLMWLEAWSEAVHDEDMRTLISELEHDWQQMLVATLRYGVERGELPATFDVDDIAEGVSALLDGLTIRVVVGYRPLDRAAAMRLVDQFLSPLLPWRDPPDENHTEEDRTEKGAQ